MLAIHSENEKLITSHREKPVFSPDEILIKIYAFGINRADLLQRRGHYLPPAGVTNILGLECAGEVVACGVNVKSWQIGDRVFALVAGGAYAEYVNIHEKLALPLPETHSFVEGAGFIEAACTAHETLFELGQLKKDETLLLSAAASGVGTMAIQMALYRGARVIGLISSDEKAEKLKQFAIQTINYKNEDFVERVNVLTHQQGVDVIEDFVGGERFLQHLNLLKKGGRLIQIATMGGRQSAIDLLILVRKHLQIKGFVLRSRSLEEKIEMVKYVHEQWWPLFKKREIFPVIDQVLKAKDIEAAHELLASNKTVGKVIVEW